MDGSMAKFVGEWRSTPRMGTIIRMILDQVRRQVKCLWDVGWAYYDVKMENVLLKLESDKIHIVLGDIGTPINFDLALPPSRYAKKLRRAKRAVRKAIGPDIARFLNIFPDERPSISTIIRSGKSARAVS